MKKDKAKQPKAKKGSPPPNDWLVEEDIRADVEDPSKVHRRGKVIRRALTIAPVVAVVALGISASANTSVTNLRNEVAAMDQEVKVDSPGKSEAIIAVNEWLADKSKPLPNGRVLSWDGKRTLAEYSLEQDEESGQWIETLGREVHRFTLVNDSGLIYETSVITVDAPGRGATVIGSPSLRPAIPTATSSLTASRWMTLESGEVTEHLRTAVDAWASAYTSGDPAKLRQVIGDPVGSNSYMPMMQVAKATAEVTGVGTSLELADKDQAVASVDLTVSWQGVKVENDSQLPVISFDVLLDKVSTAAPVVVAWTDGGLGDTLTPYSNAAEGLDITADSNQVSVKVNEGAE